MPPDAGERGGMVVTILLVIVSIFLSVVQTVPSGNNSILMWITDNNVKPFENIISRFEYLIFVKRTKNVANFFLDLEF